MARWSCGGRACCCATTPPRATRSTTGSCGCCAPSASFAPGLQRALSSRSYARLELGALGYWNADDTSGGAEAGVAVRFSWSVNAGLGAYF